MKRNKVTLLNMSTGLLLQLCTVISGFILPRLILSYFGSDVNGLVTSLNQFLAYISLVEGGISGVIMANLYKPLVQQDDAKISAVMASANRFYKRVGFVFIIYALILAVVYPLIFNTGFSFLYVASLTLILSITKVIQYMFSLTMKTLLRADKKNYIVSLSQVVIVILNLILAYLSLKLYPDIHVLKLISCSLFVIQPILYSRYVRRHYAIDWKAKPDDKLIRERWNGFAINVAAFIHNSTDVTLLTIFTSLKTVSVYSVYALVSSGLKELVNACLTGIDNAVGHAYAKENWKELHQKLDLYEYIVFLLVTLLFTVGCLLITPFITIYTKGVTDADYYQPVFGYLLLLAEAIHLVKVPHLNLAYVANKFREITRPAFIESFLNIAVSIVLVQFMGLTGVAIGTVVGMSYRSAFHVYYTSKIIPDRPQRIFYTKLCIFAATALAAYFLCSTLIPFTSYTIGNWVLHGILYGIITGGCIGVVTLLCFRKELGYLLSYLGIRK